MPLSERGSAAASVCREINHLWRLDQNSHCSSTLMWFITLSVPPHSPGPAKQPPHLLRWKCLRVGDGERPVGHPPPEPSGLSLPALALLCSSQWLTWGPERQVVLSWSAPVRRALCVHHIPTSLPSSRRKIMMKNASVGWVIRSTFQTTASLRAALSFFFRPPSSS